MRKTKTVGFHIKLLEHFTYLMYGHARIAPINGVPDTDWKKILEGKGLCINSTSLFFSNSILQKLPSATHCSYICTYIVLKNTGQKL